MPPSLSSRLTLALRLLAFLAPVLTLSTAPACAVGSPTPPDFNGDGIGDLAIGVPGESVGTVNRAGAVNVLYGTVGGLSSAQNQIWHQNLSGVADAAEAYDAFGSTLAWGDFNGDGISDLAVGVRDESLGSVQGAGVVHVLYGTVGGLSTAQSQYWHQNRSGMPGAAEAYDYFGGALAAADFNRDGRDDLAITALSDTVAGVPGAGAVHILFGTVSGLDVYQTQYWHQNRSGIHDVCEPYESFGQPLAAGDFDGDGIWDLAIGATMEAISGVTGAGAVHVLHGTIGGLDAARTQFWHQNSSGVPGAVNEYDRFGSELSAGDYNHDGRDDLAVGVPFETVNGHNTAGVVNILYGSGNGLWSGGAQYWHQDQSGIQSETQNDEWFGVALASGDFDGDGDCDLAIGVSDEDFGASTDVGAVQVLYGTIGGLHAAGNQIWRPGTNGLPGTADPDTYFGLFLTASDMNGDGRMDLAVGAPDALVSGLYAAGTVTAIYGTNGGLDGAQSQLWHQNISGVAEIAEISDGFGFL